MRERRARVAQLRARGDQHQQRHAGAPLHQVLDQIEQQRLGPLQIVDRRARPACPAASAASKRRTTKNVSSGAAGVPAEQRRDAGRDARAVGVAAVPTRSSIAARTSSAFAPSSSRRSARSASASGAKVAPPAASQCALDHGRAVSEPARRARRSSATCRGPASRGRTREPGRAAGDRRVVHAPSGVAARRRVRRTPSAGAPAGRSSDTTRYAATVSARPFSASVPNGASVTSRSTSRRVASPISTSPSLRLLLQARRDVHRIADDVVVRRRSRPPRRC